MTNLLTVYHVSGLHSTVRIAAQPGFAKVVQFARHVRTGRVE